VIRHDVKITTVVLVLVAATGLHYSSNRLDKVRFNDIIRFFMLFCMLCMVAFCQSVLLKRDDDDDDVFPTNNLPVTTTKLITNHYWSKHVQLFSLLYRYLFYLYVHIFASVLF